jgi:hypothetical protein
MHAAEIAMQAVALDGAFAGARFGGVGGGCRTLSGWVGLPRRTSVDAGLSTPSRCYGLRRRVKWLGRRAWAGIGAMEFRSIYAGTRLVPEIPILFGGDESQNA